MEDFLSRLVLKTPLSNGVPGVQVQSLAGELRLHMLWGVTQKLKKKKVVRNGQNDAYIAQSITLGPNVTWISKFCFCFLSLVISRFPL